MIIIDPKEIQHWYQKNRQSRLHGRWITLKDIEPIIQDLGSDFKFERIGTSTLNKPIYKIAIGTGKINILVWSQMHGNESTGTKALFDLLQFFNTPKGFTELREQILSRCKITFIPILNPDGAEAYTRVNANNIDLNRDVIDQKAPESKLLLSILKEINPAYCFNLHDQRTIFTVGNTVKSATLSFLAPSQDEKRTVTDGRKETMKVIVAMNNLLQQFIPDQIGRYTDEFYPTATGDNFQKMGHNTILIEAGHYENDYERERVRMYNFIALLEGLNYISSSKVLSHKSYFDIPNNTKNYLDQIYYDVYLTSEKKKVDVGVLFKEILKNDKVIFNPEIERIGDLKSLGANSIFKENELKFTDKTELQRFLKKKVNFLGFI